VPEAEAAAAAAVEVLPGPVEGELELQWLETALEGQSRRVIWHDRESLVVPGSYRRFPQLDAASRQFATMGWPVRVRRSGGGLVPQGPGILNVTLALPVDGDGASGPGPAAEGVYRDLCTALAEALSVLGIEARTQPVAGSFCDGRFNLAVRGRKIAGTAQYWRRRGGRQAVLAHALLLVDVDPAVVTDIANRFEAAIGSERRYLAEASTSVVREARAGFAEVAPCLREALLARLGTVRVSSSPQKP